ncbi:MAG: antibiotic biosynthesis monooxygenase [Saprospiraceae bacterium]|nr:antibiotic biosynthesis monooxygenase [Saprospiraceae bacterium]
MDQSVYWNLELHIKPEKKDTLQSLIDDMSASTKENEAGTLNYEWQVNEDMTECHIFERYTDSDALMVHLGNFQANFAERFFGILDIKRWQVYGNPNDQVKETLGSMGAQFLGRAGGFSR